MKLESDEWGDPSGDPVICVHGVTGHRGRFRKLAERLPGRRVIGVDLRGHGDSGWEPPWDIGTHLDDLIETAAALGIERAAWIGHSFGGRLVAELGTRDPERVTASILLDPALWIEPEIAGERAEGLRADLSFGSPEEAIEARLADGSLFTTPRELLVEEAASHLVHSDDGRFRWRYSCPAVIVAWSEMSRRGAGTPPGPCLAVFGERSWIPPAPLPRRGDIRVVNVPGGHTVLWDDFEATAAAISSFV